MTHSYIGPYVINLYTFWNLWGKCCFLCLWGVAYNCYGLEFCLLSLLWSRHSQPWLVRCNHLGNFKNHRFLGLLWEILISFCDSVCVCVCVSSISLKSSTGDSSVQPGWELLLTVPPPLFFFNGKTIRHCSSPSCYFIIFGIMGELYNVVEIFFFLKVWKNPLVNYIGQSLCWGNYLGNFFHFLFGY